MDQTYRAHSRMGTSAQARRVQDAGAGVGTDGVEDWWRRFLHHLGRSGVPRQQVPSYRRRIQQLLDRHRDLRAALIPAAAVDAFLTDLSTMAYRPWQLLQAVIARQRWGPVWTGLAKRIGYTSLAAIRSQR
jgi:hypothetical protein